MQLYLQYHHCHQQHFIIIRMKAASKQQKLMSFIDAKSLKNRISLEVQQESNRRARVDHVNPCAKATPNSKHQ